MNSNALEIEELLSEREEFTFNADIVEEVKED